MIGAIASRLRRFTAEDDARILRLSAAGWSGRRIAGELGCGHTSVNDRLRRLRLGEKMPAPAPAPAPRRAGRKFTPEEDQQLLALYADGLSAPQIGAQIGRTHQSIYARLQVLWVRSGTVNTETKGKARAQAVSYAGVVRCLGGCGQSFRSWDRRKNRICPTCRKRQDGTPGGMNEHYLAF